MATRKALIAETSGKKVVKIFISYARDNEELHINQIDVKASVDLSNVFDCGDIQLNDWNYIASFLSGFLDEVIKPLDLIKISGVLR